MLFVLAHTPWPQPHVPVGAAGEHGAIAAHPLSQAALLVIAGTESMSTLPSGSARYRLLSAGQGQEELVY